MGLGLGSGSGGILTVAPAPFCLPLRYLVGHDPAGWLAVHPENGLVTARDHLDRESPFAKNSTYTAMLLAVDDGECCERGPCSHHPA